MSTGIFSIGTSALNAAYTALRTAGNNIANANTPGYTRQVTVLTPQVGTFLGGQYLGQGVAIDDVRRVYNDFLTQQAHLAQAQSSQAEVRYTNLAQLQNLFADSTTGIGTTIDNFFSAVQDLTQNAADPAARQGLLSAANLMAARFNDVGDRLQEMRNSTDQQLRLEIATVNRLAQQIAQLNDKIALAQGAGSSPNALLDQRDAAIRSLNESIRVSAVSQSDGAVNLFLANGQPLVVGNSASTVAMGLDPIDPQEVQVGIQTGTTLIPLEAGEIGGGKIAGLLQFRSGDLPKVENELGRLAVTLAEQFNIQHRLGQDRNGSAGGDFFAAPTPNAFAAGANAGTGVVSATWADTTQLQASDYRLEYVGSQYLLTRMSDGTQTTYAGVPITVDGLTIDVAGAPANGDIFLVQPLRGAARAIDVAITQTSEIAAANPVAATLPSTNVGNLTIDDLSVVGPTRDPNLTNAATLQFTSATTYTITSGSTTVTGTYTSGQPITFNGWSLSVRGTPQAGDQVQIGANVGGIGDNRNAIKLSQLQSLGLADGAQLSGAFAAVVARVGGDTQTAELYAESQATILTDALDAESAVSGVNLDEEASRLIQYQQQYQAAAKVLATAQAIFEEILSIGR
jgi:flagellar hook-associated protein 1 FlgK